ncbi:hypothetical protein ACQE98_15980 [Ornithinimicrobium sp. W1679]|uniref:hypothetical protein n=1 Tax=Ornithinimicrobium sp. W1679 TaxID=3418770 RepID=UPI003CFA21F8
MELSEARGVLAEVAQVLPRARWELSRMRLDVLDAEARLRSLGSHGPQRPPGADSVTRGQALRGVVISCRSAAAAGGRVERRLAEAVAGIRAAGVLVDGLAPVDTQGELDQIRVRRQLSTLRTDLQATRALLGETTRALGEVADQTRRVSPSGALPGEDVPVRRLTGGVLTAQEQTRSADQELDRAQVLTDRLACGVDTLAQAARERMRAHRDRDHSHSPLAPSPGVPR